jgi:tRNA 5-methylaminomethyl-2-thiouridine biosynthesis bifunctional protein
MPPTVHWQPDGTPISPCFNDVYHSCDADGSIGWAQAQQVFLGGCNLPGLWGDYPNKATWQILETGFGLGLNFLTTCRAWFDTPVRPARLYYSAVEAFPVSADDLLKNCACAPVLTTLAQELCEQWYGLLPGIHRIALAKGQIQLTLAVGLAHIMLPQLSGSFDSIFLDGFTPHKNPDMWNGDVITAVARLAHLGTSLSTWCVAAEVRQRLTSVGFEVERVAGLPPKRHALRARYAPHWKLSSSRKSNENIALPAQSLAKSNMGHAVIVGAGLAGASTAYALAQRGWRVTILARGASPADGASALPAGVTFPNVSPDDAPLSRLTRAGVVATLDCAAGLLTAGQDWALTGVLERHKSGQRRIPLAWHDWGGEVASQPLSVPLIDDDASKQIVQKLGIEVDPLHPAIWHKRAGWIKPGSLINAMLAQPHISWRAGITVARIEHIQESTGRWRLFGAANETLIDADLLILAAGFDTLELLRQSDLGDPPPLHALRGQVAYGSMHLGNDDNSSVFPSYPINGNGSLVADVPLPGLGKGWIVGSTFERDQSEPILRTQDHLVLLEHFTRLVPAAAQCLAPRWNSDAVQSWAAVRCTAPDRLPLIGPWARLPISDPRDAPWLLTGLGARGLTLAVLCGQILAAWLHDEPLPIERRLASMLRAGRYYGKSHS